MYVYNGRSKIIKLFEDKNIKPTNFPYNVKSELEPELQLELEPELEPPFEENTLERTKMRRQKNLMIHNLTLLICLI